MTREELVAGLEALSPFLHKVDLPHGLSTTPHTRLANAVDHIWPRMLKHFGGSLEGLRVLDLACNCGGFSFEAAKSGASEVFGIDIVEHYVKQANFIKEAIGASNVRFEKASLDDLNPETHGMFDLTFCFGILYHLENPVATMRKVASVTKSVMIVDTALADFDRPVWRMQVLKGPGKATTALWRAEEGTCQLVPSKSAVTLLMQFLGFRTVEYLEATGKILDEPRYREGNRGTFLAARHGATEDDSAMNEES